MKIYEENMAKAKKTFEEISQNVRDTTSPFTAPSRELIGTAGTSVIDAIKNQICSIDTISNSSAGMFIYYSWILGGFSGHIRHDKFLVSARLYLLGVLG